MSVVYFRYFSCVFHQLTGRDSVVGVPVVVLVFIIELSLNIM